jgi:hypothetical protein
METHTIFCSACDRPVRIVSDDGAWPQALRDGEVRCAEHGVGCLGTACPFCAGCLDSNQRREMEAGAPGPA